MKEYLIFHSTANTIQSESHSMHDTVDKVIYFQEMCVCVCVCARARMCLVTLCCANDDIRIPDGSVLSSKWHIKYSVHYKICTYIYLFIFLTAVLQMAEYGSYLGA